jgi:uncharacterized cysteine cluster protein YcgN (CxxCxxCC family)
MKKDNSPYWKRVPLDKMTQRQWEDLCDGCGRCCLRKLEFEDTGEIVYTNVACTHLDIVSCRCRSYHDRAEKKPECLVLSPETLHQSLHLLPDTCAYRLVARGEDLPRWHPLVCGDPFMVHKASISVSEKAVSEDHVHDEELEDHIIEWVCI